MREGGGPTKKLHRMCNKLDTLKIPYFVTPLGIGDYCFFAHDNKNFGRQENMRLCPIIIERKSIQDVAQSIFDGRWVRQKRRMYQAQYVFGYDNCRMAYIIEGSIDSQELTGGYIGHQQFQVSREQLDKEIEDLNDEGFDVLRTQTPDHSMVELSRWACKILDEYRGGSLKAQYTYEEFCRQVDKIPRLTDFSRIAKDERARRMKTSYDGKTVEAGSKSQTTAITTKKQTSVFNKNSQLKQQDSYKDWTLARLKKQCEDWGLAKSGTKATLIQRLNGPRPPRVLLERKSKGLYVPSRHNTCASAILVALWLEQFARDSSGAGWNGLTKDELYVLAESLNISKDPFSGKSNGAYTYDGWSSMSDLRGGELPLVTMKKGRFKLTTTSEISGIALAQAVHQWCHEYDNCSCVELGHQTSP